MPVTRSGKGQEGVKGRTSERQGETSATGANVSTRAATRHRLAASVDTSPVLPCNSDRIISGSNVRSSPVIPGSYGHRVSY